MKLEKLNKICFTVCIVCIIAGTVLALAMVWLDLHKKEFVWKPWLTIAIIFSASALTVSVTKTLGMRGDEK